MRLYDTVRAEIVPFEPGPVVRTYVCGITPYDSTHLGHAFTYLTHDILNRRLVDLGHTVQMVRNVTDVQVWMVLVILIRELFVSAIRSHAEARGVDFSADWVGKIKMVIQSTAACFIVGQLAWFPDEEYPLMALGRTTLVWMTVVVTGLSLLTYAGRARRFLFSREALAGPMKAAPAPPAPDAAPEADEQSK